MGSVDRESRGAVLVVDDDEGLRYEIRDVLEAEGYFVVEARDGVHAIEVLSSTVGVAVRLVILDLLMPYMTGWELVELLCRDRRFSHLSILVMSGLSVHGDASGIGATRSWIRKPFGTAELISAVNSTVGEKRESDSDGRTQQETGRTSVPSHHDG